MTKRKAAVRAAPGGRPTRPKRITASKANIARALKELGINKPYYRARVVGGRLELLLYGGDIVYWPEAPSDEKQPEEE